MTNKVIIEWVSPEEKTSGVEFNNERAAKFLQMGLNPNTDLVNEEDSATATVTFKNIELANEWINFIQNLAKKYNKNILNITTT